MLAEFLKALREGLRAEVRPQLLAEVTDARSARYAMPDGGISTFERPKPLRRWTITSFTDLCVLLLDQPDALVFHDAGRIRALLDAEDRHETVTMTLEHTDTFLALLELAGPEGKSFKAPDLVRFLRRRLRLNPELIAKFRRVDFTRLEQTKADVQRGRESLGRAVEASVQQIDDVPETFDVGCELYSTPGIREHELVHGRYTVSVHVDLTKQLIELSVDSEAITLGYERAHTAIRALLPKDVPAYRGDPGSA